jgi:hypothetical protein
MLYVLVHVSFLIKANRPSPSSVNSAGMLLNLSFASEICRLSVKDMDHLQGEDADQA